MHDCVRELQSTSHRIGQMHDELAAKSDVIASQNEKMSELMAKIAALEKNSVKVLKFMFAYVRFVRLLTAQLQYVLCSQTLTVACVLSYRLSGLPAVQLDRLQSVLNAAARLIYRRRKFDRVSPLIKELHWLRVPERITFRLAVLAYRCQHNMAPRYPTCT